MTGKPTVLVVDDELSIRESFNLILSDHYRVLTAATGEAGIKYAADESVDLIYLDIRMPGLNGLETLRRIKEIKPEQEVIMVTAVNDLTKASEAIKSGARDYLVKPFDVEKILKMTADLVRRKSLKEETRKVALQATAPDLAGKSSKIEAARQRLKSCRGWALIVSPEGCEREAAARVAAAELMALDLALIPQGAQEGRLFGTSEGGTVADIVAQEGLIERAGTLFLDHIELLDPLLQKKLLHSNVRLIGGTSLNLKETQFDRELYDKLSEVMVELPPLSERAGDIPQLLEYFLETANSKYFRRVKLSPSVLETLSAYDYPGNVAELNNLVELMVLSSASEEIADLPLNLILATGGVAPLEDLYASYEKKLLGEVLGIAGGDKIKAAQLLGISSQVLETKI